MNAFVLHELDDRAAMARWSASAAIIVALHAAVIAFGMAWYTHSPPPGVALPTIMIDLAPASAPSVQPLDLPPGPEMREADPPPPPPEPPKQEAVQEQLAPTPPQDNPIVEAPPEHKMEPPPKPEPAKIVPDQPKPVPVKPKPVRTEVKKPADAPPAPRTSAAPKAERQASLTSSSAPAPAGAMSAAALASYNQLVAAHLQRFKQYPSSAKAAGEQGTSRLSFTLGRSGQVLGSRLAGSSGHPALDSETLAMVRRAQPFPPMPSELKQASMSFSIPVQFSIR
jgi:periplasmic protein TonB